MRARDEGRPDADGATRFAADRVWPYWLERQLDPRSPAFVPSGGRGQSVNVTARNWTVVGTVGSAVKAIVDPRGLVTPWSDGWSLDWWILGEDRWHFPSQDAAVRQQLVDDTPVVETSMRIRGGDASQRVYAVPGPEPLAVVEIENRTRTPIAVALSIRPYNPTGLAVVERIELEDRTVTVDGRAALLLPRRPQGMAAATYAEGDVVGRVLDEETPAELPDGFRCRAGLATAAFVFPIAHTASLRVGLPLDPARREGRRARTKRRPERAVVQLPDELPTSEDVARSWRAQTSGRGLRIVVPEGRLSSAVEANRRHLLLCHEGDEVVAGAFTDRRWSFRDAAQMLGALDRYGFHRESAEVVASYAGRQRVDGMFVGGVRTRSGGNGAALHAMAEHWRLTGSLEGIDAETVVLAVGWIERKRHARKGRPPEVDADDGVSERLGRPDEDDFWSLRGLLDGAALLQALGEDEAAATASAWATSLRRDLEASLVVAAEPSRRDTVAAGSLGPVDPEAIGTLAACAPLRLFPAGHAVVDAVAETVRQRCCVGPAFFEGERDTGLSPALTLRLAAVELEAGDERCLERLSWCVDAATPTHTWPRAIHPGLGGGCAGDGHDGRVAAAFLDLVRNLLVREVGDDGLALCTLLPESWRHQPLEVHDAPTHFGSLSFAIRWHGARPALLWDLKRRGDDTRVVRLTIPGLDATWSTTESKGEALLAAPPSGPPPAADPTPAPEGSFS